MPLNDQQIQTAWQMASEGWTIEAIRKHLELPEDGGWQEVRKHVDSWLGTKNQITYRLNALAEEPDADKRNELKCEKVVYGTQDGSVIQSVYIDKDALGSAPPETLQVVISPQ